MNAFRRLMIVVSTVAAFVVGMALGRMDAGAAVSVAALFAVAAMSFWSLSGWDIPDTRASLARETLDALQDDLRSEMEATVKAGRKIEAIKIFRAATGQGLAEGKAVVDLIDHIQKTRGSDI